VYFSLRWAKTAQALTIPFDEAMQIHPEFVGMPAKGARRWF
jgi:hypothetical protein